MESEGVTSFGLFFIPMIFVFIFPKSPLLFHLIFNFDSHSLLLSLISLCVSHSSDLVVVHSSSSMCWQMSVVLFDECLLLCILFLVGFIFPKEHTSDFSRCICTYTARNKQSFQTVLSAVLSLVERKKKCRFFTQDVISYYFFTKNCSWNKWLSQVWFISRHKKCWDEKTVQKVFRKCYHSQNKNLYCTLKQPNSNTKMEETGEQGNGLKENTQYLKKFFQKNF